MGYTDDYQLPVVNIYTPHRGENASAVLKVGFSDAKSGLDWSTLEVSYYWVDSLSTNTVAVNVAQDVNSRNILNKALALGAGDYVLTVSIRDKTGNKGIASVRNTNVSTRNMASARPPGARWLRDY